jgi:predicted amidohydrolase YtcJ
MRNTRCARGHPTRADLDETVPHRPAVLYHRVATRGRAEHGRAAGSRVRRQTAGSAGGAFGRDSRGRFDGVIYERPMFTLFERNLRHDITGMGAAARARLVLRAASVVI